MTHIKQGQKRECCELTYRIKGAATGLSIGFFCVSSEFRKIYGSLFRRIIRAMLWGNDGSFAVSLLHSIMFFRLFFSLLFF